MRANARSRKYARTVAPATSHLQARQIIRGRSLTRENLQGRSLTCSLGHSIEDGVTLEKIGKYCCACSVTLATKGVQLVMESARSRKYARTVAPEASHLLARQIIRGRSLTRENLQGWSLTCTQGNSIEDRVTLEKMSKDCSICSVTLAGDAI